MFSKVSDTKGRRNIATMILTSIFFLITILSGMAMSAKPAMAAATYFVDTDNEDNAGTGSGDGDMDTATTSGSGNHPIEFNLDLTGASPTTTAHLVVNALGVEEESGDVLQVSINGNTLGSLAGETGINSSSVFAVPLNQVSFGDNLTEINVSAGATTTINWAQLLIDGGAQSDASISTFRITGYATSVGTVTMNVDVSSGVTTTGNFRLEVNLKDQSGNIVDIVSTNFAETAGNAHVASLSPSYTESNSNGTYTIEALLFFNNGSFDVQQDYESITFSHLQNLGPNMPATTQQSTVSTSDATLVADGVATTTVTLQGVDLEGSSTTLSGQTIVFSTTSGLISSVSDQGNGTYTATLTSSTTAGSASIIATIDGSTVSDTATVSFTAGTAYAPNTSLISSSPNVVANGVSVSNMIVQLVDVFGNNLTQSGGSVSLVTDLGTLGPVQNFGDGTYTAVLTSPITTGTATVNGFVNSVAFSDTATTNFTAGSPSITQSLITASPTTLTANGSAVSTIIVSAIDNNGNSVTSGGATVLLSATNGSLSTVNDLGNGFYSSLLTSSTFSGFAVVTGSIDGLDILDSDIITFVPGPVSALTSTVSAASTIVANGTSTAVVTVQAADSNNNLVESGSATVTMTTDRGVISSVSDMGDGTYLATLTSTTVAADATITATIDGVTVPDTAVVSFVPGNANIAFTTISALHSSLAANGATNTVITLRAFDVNANPLIQGGNGVVMTTSAGTISQVVDNGNGTYEAVLTSATNVTTARVSAILDGAEIDSFVNINFVPGAAEGDTSTINASLNVIVGDGATETLITVQTIDREGNFLIAGGDTVIIAADNGTLSPLIDQGDGTYTATLTSSNQAVVSTIEGIVNGDFFVDNELITFTAPPSVNTQISNDSTPSITGTIPAVPNSDLSVRVGGITYPLNGGDLGLNGPNWTLVVPFSDALSEGIYSVTAIITDGDGQSSLDVTSSELELDLTAPTANIDVLLAPGSLNIPSFQVTGACTEIGDILSIDVTDTLATTVGATGLTCTDDGTGSGEFSAVFDLRTLVDGSVTIGVDIDDVAGNSGQDILLVTKDACVPDNSVSLCDTDSDGLSNGDELAVGMNPNSIDSDGDGISDFIEIEGDISDPVDTDGDGIINSLDEDSDNDGLTDASELGSVPSTPLDSDGDGIEDFKDRDSDNDFIPDYIESRYSNNDPDGDLLPNHLDLDSDGDGIPDSFENGVTLRLDTDFDGIDDAFDVSQTNGSDGNFDGIDDSIVLIDNDGDTIFNMFDIDSDNDGMTDEFESDLMSIGDADGDGISNFFDIDSTGGIDADNDGVDDTVVLPDTDSDSIDDYLDLDSDNDSISDVIEVGGADLAPRDGIIDFPIASQGTITSATDGDGDGIPDFRDLESGNEFNNGAGPFDIDVRLDVSEVDSNGDGLVDLDTDGDGDGIADGVDEAPVNFGSPEDFDDDGILNRDDLDDDNDGVPDTEEGTGDSDGDGQFNITDLDSDNDGISDLIEGNTNLADTNNDGVVDTLVDTDADGWHDDVSKSYQGEDTDRDGTPDYRDLDSDGDGIFDLVEANKESVDFAAIDSNSDGRLDTVGDEGVTNSLFSPIDTDNDGVANYVDLDSDGDSILDGDENTDANDDGVNDRLQKAQGKISTSIQGAGSIGSELFIFIALAVILFGRRLIVRYLSLPLALLLILPLGLLSNDVKADDDLCGYRIDHHESVYLDDYIPGHFQNCWYSGLGLFSSSLKPEGESAGWSLDSGNSFGASIHGGYRFSPHWHVELSYSYLGEASLTNSNAQLDKKIDASLSYSNTSVNLGYWMFPEFETFNLYLKAGAGWLYSSASEQTVSLESQSDSQYMAGGGVQYRISQSSWFINFDYASYSKDAATFGIVIGRYYGRSTEPILSQDTTLYHKIHSDEAINDGDSDQDGVKDSLDLCPLTLKGTKVSESGCCASDSCSHYVVEHSDGEVKAGAYEKKGDNKDTDKDGVRDKNDLCPHTIMGVKVQANGCT